MATSDEKKAAAKAQKTPAKADEPAKPAEKQAAEGDFVQVKFLRSHPAFGYFAGDTGRISRADFDAYSADGPFFEEITDEAAEPQAE